MISDSDDWTVHIFAGLGPLRYGMDQHQVQSTIGEDNPAQHRDAEMDGTVREHRGLNFPVCSYVAGKLSGIDTSWRISSVILNNSLLYQLSPIDCLMFLEEMNGGANISFELILFENLGISVAGFYSQKLDKILTKDASRKDQRRIGFHKKGAFQKHMNDFSKISFF